MDLAKREMTLLVVLSFSVYEFTIKVSLPLILEENLKLVQIWKLRPLYESYEVISSNFNISTYIIFIQDKLVEIQDKHCANIISK